MVKSDSTRMHLDPCSVDFRRIVNESDWIPAKGRDNLQGLGPSDEEVFFLLRIRCKVRPGDINWPLGTLS